MPSRGEYAGDLTGESANWFRFLRRLREEVVIVALERTPTVRACLRNPITPPTPYDSSERSVLQHRTDGKGYVCSHCEQEHEARQVSTRLLGYQVAVRCRIPGRHSACTVLVAPVPNWEERGCIGPMMNHTCFVKHVNCEYVSTDVDEDGQQTVMVRTTRNVCMGEEFGEQFTTVLST